MNKKIISLLIITMILFVAGCQNTDNPSPQEGTTDNEDKKIVIGSKPMAEQYIIAEILSQLVETHSDIEVERKFGIAGGTSNLHPALMEGEIDMYPEYSGTGWLFVLKEKLISDPQELFEETQNSYREKYNLVWTAPYSFNNTYALAIKDDLAQELDIESFSDLAKVSPDIIFGAEYDFYERDDGFPALVHQYDLHFKEEKEVDIALKYQAIDSGEVEVINSFSTDGLLKEYDMKVLKDDQNFFPSYQAATIVRQETLEQYPELEEILNKLSGQISDEEMIDMNYEVEMINRNPADVAHDFLVKKELL